MEIVQCFSLHVSREPRALKTLLLVPLQLTQTSLNKAGVGWFGILEIDRFFVLSFSFRGQVRYPTEHSITQAIQQKVKPEACWELKHFLPYVPHRQEFQ